MNRKANTSRLLCLFIVVSLSFVAYAKDSTSSKKAWEIPAVKFSFDKSGSRFIQFNAAAQIWTRFNESNPGTMVDNEIKPYTFDIGLRRVRLWTVAKPLEWMTLAVQFGINNFSTNSTRKAGFFVHDAYVEFAPAKQYLQIGAGLVSSMGFARYSSPAIASALLYDVPLYQQATNDISDQFLRKLSIYAKGQVNGFDYRVAVSDPLSISLSSVTVSPISQNASFTPKGKSLQYSGYFQWQFFDKEQQLTPYFTGTYLGAKKVVNLGVGFQVQPKATWNLNARGDTLYNTMLLANVDVFADLPLTQKKDDGLTIYGAYSYTNFGQKYLRMTGAMNPGVGLDATRASLNGTGSAYPMIGTGHTIYFQTGYKLPSSFFGGSGFSIQPVFDVQSSKFTYLNGWASTFNSGLNFLLVGNKAKLSLGYQNRPIFDSNTLKQIDRKSAVILQWQIAI